MSDASVLEIMLALGGQLDEQLAATPALEGLQVAALFVRDPTPPCIDIYPGDPFGEQVAFDHTSRELLFTIRARVDAADVDAGQELLLGLMDRGPGSVLGAHGADRTLGGAVDTSVLEGPTGFSAYAATQGAATGSLLGCEWRLRVEV